jgi:1,2-diacylglycerol 3-beta-glucosyltransferase
MIYQSINIMFLVVFGGLILYLAILSILAACAKSIKPNTSLSYKRFAIVVPAHNEEVSLSKTVQSLLEIEYPKTHYDIIVVADNCTDSTVEIAKTSGAKVFERTNAQQRGKGYALRWCFDIILGPEFSYDAVAIVDADSVVSKNFLSVINQYIHNGSGAIQVSDMVEPKPGNWSSEITRLGFTLYNHVRPLGRKVINCSAGVRGNGMCFSVKTLREIPWDTYSLNEDLEYGLILLLNGVQVDFAPETFVIATMPTQPQHAVSQRSRWERGRFPVIRKYSVKLLTASVTKLSYIIFDALIELVTPAFVNLFGFTLLMFCVSGLLFFTGVDASMLFLILWGMIVLLGLMHVFIGLYAVGVDRLLLKAFFYVPKYVLWKLMVYVKIFHRQNQNEWVRTTREQVDETYTKIK